MIKRCGMLVLATLLIGSAAALAADPVNSTGKENFMRYCAACHGAGGLGDGPVSTAIFKSVPDLTMISARNGGVFPRQKIMNSIDGRWEIDAHGARNMPVWGYEFWISAGAGEFSDHGVTVMVSGLADYLESIQADGTQPVSAK
jgi:mono/diheme cytochrome c family protein